MFSDIATGVLAAAAVVQLGVVVVAAVYAKRQVAEARRQVDEAKSLREAQARPFVVLDLNVEDTLIWLKIRNLGPSLAQDVRFAFDPPLRASWDDERELPPLSETQLFTSGIPSLAPGKEVSMIFDHFPGREGKREGGAELPDAYAVTITYRSDELNRSYTDRTVIDLGIYRNLVHTSRYDVHDIHERLKEIRDLLKKWTSAAPQGLRTVTREDEREYRDASRREHRERVEQQAREAEATAQPDGDGQMQGG